MGDGPTSACDSLTADAQVEGIAPCGGSRHKYKTTTTAHQ